MTPPRSRWLRFSLRTLFLALTVLAVPLGWATSWRSEREALNGEKWLSSKPQRAPFPLNLIGADGYDWIVVPSDSTAEEFERARALFPEAQIKRRHRQPVATIDYMPFDQE